MKRNKLISCTLALTVFCTSLLFSLSTSAEANLSERIAGGENVVTLQSAWEQAAANGAFLGTTPVKNMSFSSKGLQVPISGNAYMSHAAVLSSMALPQDKTIYRAEITVSKENFAQSSAIELSGGNMIGTNPQIYYYHDQALAEKGTVQYALPDDNNCFSWDFDAQGHMYYSSKFSSASGGNVVEVKTSDGNAIDFKTSNGENARFTLTVFYISSQRNNGNKNDYDFTSVAYITKGTQTVEEAIAADNNLAAAGQAKGNCSAAFSLGGAAYYTDFPSLSFRMSRTDNLNTYTNQAMNFKKQAANDTYFESVKLAFIQNPEIKGATVKVADADNQNLRFTADCSARSESDNFYAVNQGMIFVAAEKNPQAVPLRAFHLGNQYAVNIESSVGGSKSLAAKAVVYNANPKVSLLTAYNVWSLSSENMAKNKIEVSDILNADILNSGIVNGAISEFIGTQVYARAFLQYAMAVPDSAADSETVEYKWYIRNAYSRNDYADNNISYGMSNRSVMGISKSISEYTIGKMGSAFDPTDDTSFITIDEIIYCRKDIVYILNRYYDETENKGTKAQQRSLILEFINKNTAYNDK